MTRIQERLVADYDRSPGVGGWSTPTRVALLYVILGLVTLFLSDVVLVFFIDRPALLRQLQAVKGGAEVVLTACFIFVVMRWHENTLRERIESDRAHIQELSVLHRVFRHNIRNKVNVVLGHANRVRQTVQDDALRTSLETIVDHASEIAATADDAVAVEKISETWDETVQMDLVGVVTEVVADYEAPTGVEIDVSGPDEAWVSAPLHLRTAIEELLDNAVTHNDADVCRVWVRIRPPGGTQARTELTIADDGPGMPAGVQSILESQEVNAKRHLTTFGLWKAYWITTRAGGTFSIEERDPRGCRIRLSVEPTTAPRRQMTTPEWRA